MKKPAIIIVAIAAAFAVNALAQTQTTVTKSEPRKASVEQTVDVTARSSASTGLRATSR